MARRKKITKLARANKACGGRGLKKRAFRKCVKNVLKHGGRHASHGRKSQRRARRCKTCRGYKRAQRAKRSHRRSRR